MLPSGRGIANKPFVYFYACTTVSHGRSGEREFEGLNQVSGSGIVVLFA